MSDYSAAMDSSQGGNTNHKAEARDAEGWVIPPLRHTAPPNRQPPEEAANQAKLIEALQGHGWYVQPHVLCTTRDGELRVPDILVWHTDLRSVGAVEVKGRIQTPRETSDALKQCFDYTQCKVLATGARVEWGAIFPFDPAFHGVVSGHRMWGAANFAAAHLKVACFMHEAAFRRWEEVKGMGNGRVRDPDRIRLQYQEINRAYCTTEGFVANAADMLFGKRKDGGRRR